MLAGGDPARAKIIDFGLAKLAADEGLTRLTEDEQVLGSPLYLAPEQSSSSSVGPEADIYALGGLAYFALTGHAAVRAALRGRDGLRARPRDAGVARGPRAGPRAAGGARRADRRVRREVAGGSAERRAARRGARPAARARAGVAARTGRSILFDGGTVAGTSEEAVGAQVRQVVLELAAMPRDR